MFVYIPYVANVAVGSVGSVFCSVRSVSQQTPNRDQPSRLASDYKTGMRLEDLHEITRLTWDCKSKTPTYKSKNPTHKFKDPDISPKVQNVSTTPKDIRQDPNM